MKEIQHFILTRFNILLWSKDKEGNKVRTIKWLEQRFLLFEHYCLPSVKNQTCHDFEWIVLFDNKTPDSYKEKIEEYKKECPMLTPVFVEPENGRYFADIFRKEIVKRLKAKRILSTYLDNDDALNIRFVEDLQCRVSAVMDGTFFYYNEGYQFYTDYHYMMQIHYPRNHFVSIVERGDPLIIKGIFGYGGHYYIDKIKGVKIERIKDIPMWCEVVHDKNMINDAYFLLGAKMIEDSERLKRDFAVNEIVKYGVGVYFFRFVPRYIRTFIRRTKYYLFGKKW